MGALAGLLSVIPAAGRLAVGGLLLVVVLGAELAGRPLSLPQNRRAVPQTVIPEARVQGALQFGFEMGTGVRTFMPTALPHALVLAVLVSGSLGVGLLAGLGFGTGRAAMPLVRAWSGAPRSWDDTLLASIGRIGQLTAVSFTALAVVALIRPGG